MLVFFRVLFLVVGLVVVVVVVGVVVLSGLFGFVWVFLVCNVLICWCSCWIVS